MRISSGVRRTSVASATSGPLNEGLCVEAIVQDGRLTQRAMCYHNHEVFLSRRAGRCQLAFGVDTTIPGMEKEEREVGVSSGGACGQRFQFMWMPTI
jgi:hypothetical protein